MGYFLYESVGRQGPLLKLFSREEIEKEEFDQRREAAIFAKVFSAAKFRML